MLLHGGSEEQLPSPVPEKSFPSPGSFECSCLSSGGGGTLGEGGRLPLLLWGGSEEQLPSPESEEICSSPGSAMAAASPAGGAARFAREDCFSLWRGGAIS